MRPSGRPSEAPGRRCAALVMRWGITPRHAPSRMTSEVRPMGAICLISTTRVYDDVPWDDKVPYGSLTLA